MQRFSLTFNDTDKKQYIIFPKNDDCTEARAPEVFDRKATREEIIDGESYAIFDGI